MKVSCYSVRVGKGSGFSLREQPKYVVFVVVYLGERGGESIYDSSTNRFI